MAEPKLSIKQMKESIREAGLLRYIADDDPRAAWASPAAVLDACLDDAQLEEEEELAPADIPAKLPWKVDS